MVIYMWIMFPSFPFFLFLLLFFIYFYLFPPSLLKNAVYPAVITIFNDFFKTHLKLGKNYIFFFFFCLSFLFGKLFLTFVRWFKRFPAKIDKRRIQQNLLFITVFYAFNNFVCTWIIKCFHFFVFTQIALSFLALSYLIMHLIINIFLHAQLNIIFKAILAVFFCCCLNEYTL